MKHMQMQAIANGMTGMYPVVSISGITPTMYHVEGMSDMVGMYPV